MVKILNYYDKIPWHLSDVNPFAKISWLVENHFSVIFPDAWQPCNEMASPGEIIIFIIFKLRSTFLPYSWSIPTVRGYPSNYVILQWHKYYLLQAEIVSIGTSSFCHVLDVTAQITFQFIQWQLPLSFTLIGSSERWIR